jgi:hypothetical protein
LLSSEKSGFVNVSIEEAKSTTKTALKQIGWDDQDASHQAEIRRKPCIRGLIWQNSDTKQTTINHMH